MRSGFILSQTSLSMTIQGKWYTACAFCVLGEEWDASTWEWPTNNRPLLGEYNDSHGEASPQSKLKCLKPWFKIGWKNMSKSKYLNHYKSWILWMPVANGDPECFAVFCQISQFKSSNLFFHFQCIKHSMPQHFGSIVPRQTVKV
jgi:hypothetical protein